MVLPPSPPWSFSAGKVRFSSVRIRVTSEFKKTFPIGLGFWNPRLTFSGIKAAYQMENKDVFTVSHYCPLIAVCALLINLSFFGTDT